MPIVLYDCKSIFGGISTTTVLAHPKADKPTTRDTRKIFNVRRLGNSIGASFCPKDDVDRPSHDVSAICSTKFIERFDPLNLPGQSPPLLDYFLPAPVTHRVSIPGLIIPGVLEVQYDQVVL